MFWKKWKQFDGKEKETVRRLFEAAAAPLDSSELPSEVFMQQLRNRIRQKPAPGYSMGNAAWQMIPAMIALVIVLCGGTLYQEQQVAKAREAAVTKMFSGADDFSSALFAVTVLGGGETR